VKKSQFGDHRRREDFGHEVEQAQAPAELVQRDPQSLVAQDQRIQLHAEWVTLTVRHVLVRGVERADHVEIGCPGFGKILPGMHRGVGADVRLGPIHRRPALVIGIQRVGVRDAGMVAEDGLALIFTAAFDKDIPIEVADLVAKVADQRPLRFAQIDAKFLALDVVSFANVDRDPAQWPV